MTDSSPLHFNSIEEMKAWIAANHPDMYEARNSKYAPKLTYVERCEALALAMSGDLDRRQIAAAYGINRATMAYIVNKSSPHYKDVRKEYHELGHDRFLRQYMTPAVIERYMAAKKNQEVALSDDELKKARSEGALSMAANKGAKKNAGPFYFSMPGETTQEKGEVIWSEEKHGWYVRVDTWGDQEWGEDEHNKTSTTAKAGFLTTNMAKEIDA